jgi:hypothetical protein
MTQEMEILIVKYFISHPAASMVEVAANTDVSKSTVQRILNKEMYSNKVIESTGRTIKEQLEYNKQIGKRKGGLTYFQNNAPIKDENGKFQGSTIIKDETDNESKKQQDIKLIVEYFLFNPNSTMEQIANTLNEQEGKCYTKSYVYDCLLDSRIEDLFGSIVRTTIESQLTYNQQNFHRKFGFLSIDLHTLSKYDLTDEEICLIMYRFNNGDLRTTEEAAKHFNCSKTVICKVENRIMNIINTKINEEEQKKI